MTPHTLPAGGRGSNQYRTVGVPAAIAPRSATAQTVAALLDDDLDVEDVAFRFHPDYQQWAATGMDSETIDAWRGLGLTADQAAKWHTGGWTPELAANSIEFGVYDPPAKYETVITYRTREPDPRDPERMLTDTYQAQNCVPRPGDSGPVVFVTAEGTQLIESRQWEEVESVVVLHMMTDTVPVPSFSADEQELVDQAIAAYQPDSRGRMLFQEYADARANGTAVETDAIRLLWFAWESHWSQQPAFPAGRNPTRAAAVRAYNRLRPYRPEHQK